MTRTLPLARKPILNFSAMALITVLLAFSPREAFPANSLYLPHIFNKFSSATGGRFCVDPPPEGPAVITCISTDMGPPGTVVTIEGRGFGWHPPSWNGVYISIPGVTGFTVQNLSWEDNKIVVQIPDRPGGDCSWSRQCQVSLSVHYEEGHWTNHVPFTITGLLPEPPHSPTWLISGPNASVGDIIEIYAYGLSPIAANNLVSFNGATAVALTYTTEEWGAPHISVRVPAGATTGPVKLKRLDGMDQWSEASSNGYSVVDFGIVPANIPTLSPGMESGGLLYAYDNVYWYGSRGASESWVLGGSGFSKLRPPDTPTPTSPNPSGFFWNLGALSLEISTPQNSITVLAFMQSDNALVVPMNGFWFTDKSGYRSYFPGPVNIFQNLQIGDIITVRVTGMELTNRQIRTSAPLSLSYSRKAPYGTVTHLGSFSLPMDVSKGDYLCIGPPPANSLPGPEHKLRAPGIWTGTLSFSYGRLMQKCFELPQAGTFKVYNDTLGESAQIRVLEEGAYVAEINISSNTLAVDGVTIGFGGGRLVIPPGALPLHDKRYDLDTVGYYGIRAFHRASTDASFDPEQFDGGHQFGVTFDPVPPELLKPITLTLPYLETGRYSPPQIAPFDNQAKLFYPLDSTVDTAAHRVSVTLPAGKPQMGLYSTGSLPEKEYSLSSAHPSLGLPLIVPFGLSFLASFVALSFAHDVSSVTDQNKYFEVDYVTSPWSLSYVTQAYAEEVLNALCLARQTLVEQDKWPFPAGTKKVSIRNLFLFGGLVTPGATTPVLGGDVWVYIDSNLDQGPNNSLMTSTGHEFGHYLQRQLLIWYPGQWAWVDEAAANWAAYHGLNGYVSLDDYGQEDLNFPTVQFPNSFISGYSTSQQYAAGAFFIWLSDPSREGPTVVRKLYEKLGSQTGYNPDSYTILEEITGSTMENIIRDFSFDFWAQKFAPINLRSLPWGINRIAGWEGLFILDSRPPLSSKGYAVAPTDAWKPTIASREGVIRALRLGEGQQVQVFGVSQPSDAPPGMQTLLGTLDWQHPGLKLNSFGAYPWYRLISVNTSRTNTSNVTLEVVAPDINRIYPESAPRWGGGTVSIHGSGFGAAPGKVLFGSQEFTLANGGIANWWASTVEINLPAGTYGQQVTIRVITAENVNSDTATFTYY